jgi:hypothetical protein
MTYTFAPPYNPTPADFLTYSPLPAASLNQYAPSDVENPHIPCFSESQPTGAEEGNLEEDFSSPHSFAADAQTFTAKKKNRERDASYVPRPPNAFILFRSSFIKSQRVSGRVEGNHSTLSKIVGTAFNYTWFPFPLT